MAKLAVVAMTLLATPQLRRQEVRAEGTCLEAQHPHTWKKSFLHGLGAMVKTWEVGVALRVVVQMPTSLDRKSHNRHPRACNSCIWAPARHNGFFWRGIACKHGSSVFFWRVVGMPPWLFHMVYKDVGSQVTQLVCQCLLIMHGTMR